MLKIFALKIALFGKDAICIGSAACLKFFLSFLQYTTRVDNFF